MAKFVEVEDELEDIKTKTKTTQTQTQTQTQKATAPAELEDEPEQKPATPTKTKAAVDDDNLDIEFGDQKVMTRSDGLNRLRPGKGEAVRFALLPFIKPKSCKSHFVEAKDKKGSYRCFETESEEEIPYCCDKLGEGTLHVVALALHYTNADKKTGKYEKGTAIEWEVGYVDLSRSNYRSVSNLAPEEATPYDIDIVMTQKENKQYEFTLVSPKARWALNPDLAAEVEEAAQKFIRDGGRKLKGKLGKVLTLTEWKALLASTASSAEDASLEDIGEI